VVRAPCPPFLANQLNIPGLNLKEESPLLEYILYSVKLNLSWRRIENVSSVGELHTSCKYQIYFLEGCVKEIKLLIKLNGGRGAAYA